MPNPYIIALAKAAGLMVMLQAVIGREEYHSVTGSLDALERFGILYEDARASAAREAGAATESR